ncbi:unnamed protein product [Allacma fusca]|uniref:DUF4806 domain-containing protein n=1 Tax=Allacma fusca TaxID=39272 RepID=A0A8J2KH75_9HEXA|nr:unnamed protein product [Allacma fusca]
MESPQDCWKKYFPVQVKLSSDDLSYVRSQQEQFLETSNLESAEETSEKSKPRRKTTHGKIISKLPEDTFSEIDADVLPQPPFVSTITLEDPGEESCMSRDQNQSTSEVEEGSSTPENVLLQVASASGHTFDVVQQRYSVGKLQVTAVEKLILEKIEALSRKIEELSTHVQALTPIHHITEGDVSDCPNLPSTTVQELQFVDQFCQSAVTNAKKMASMLSRVGGRNVKDAIENVLSELMADCVAIEYNWAGTKRGGSQKLAFKNTRLVALIHDSVKIMKNHARVERVEIEEPIKVWLKNAGARLKRTNIHFDELAE